MNCERTDEPPEPLEHDMRVRFSVDEMNNFYRRLEPIDLDELWSLLDYED